MKVSNDDHVTVKLHFVTLALVALGPLLPVKPATACGVKNFQDAMFLHTFILACNVMCCKKV